MKKSHAPKSLGVSASLREPEQEDGQPALVPKLRFPEFQGAETWEKRRLEELVDIQSGATPSKANPAFWNGSIPWVSAKDMKQLFLEDAEDHISDAAIKDGARLVPAGTLLMLTRGMTLLKDVPICVLRREMSFNQDVKGLRPKDQVDGLFLAWMLTGNKDRLLAMVDIAGHGTGKLDTDELKALQLMLPSPREQQKIAECLSSVDELMAAQGRKVDALKTHKKGLMQQLFPREGETQPRLRFPEFQNAGEWESKPFEEFVTKSFYGTSSSTSATGKYPVLRMGNMVDGGLDFTNLVYLDLDADAFESFRLEDGDILLNRTNSPALVGKIALFQLKSDCITASYIVTYRLNQNRMVPAFCNSMLNTPLYQSRIRSFAKPSVSQANINPTTFKKELIVTVPSLSEQERIASCLSSLDALITAETQKLAALQTHKRGLMQQLFPSPEKVEV